MAANCGRGGLRRWFTTIVAHADTVGADIILASEALPDDHGLHSAAFPAWRWTTQPHCSRAAASAAQAQGVSTSGGAVVLVRDTPLSCPGLQLQSVTPVPTDAANIGDAVLATVTYTDRRSRNDNDDDDTPRLLSIRVAAVYLLPATVSNSNAAARRLCYTDTDCTASECPHQHPVASLHAVLAAANRLCAADDVPTIVGGDCNTHIVGPTADAVTAPNSRSRVNAVRAALQTHSFTIVNGFADGQPPRQPVQPTRVHHRATGGRPATLDLVLTHSSFTHHLVACTVDRWPAAASHDLDHAPVLARVMLSAVSGTPYVPSPGAPDIAVIRARPSTQYVRLPNTDPAWLATVASLEPAVRQLAALAAPPPHAHGGGPPDNGDTHLVFHDTNAPDAVTNFLDACDTAAVDTGVANKRTARKMYRHPDTIDGAVARTARELKKLRRRVAALTRADADVPGALLAAVNDAADANRAAANTRSTALRAAAEAHLNHVTSTASVAPTRPPDAAAAAMNLGVACATRKASARAAATTVHPGRLHHAPTARQAVQEWTAHTSRADASRLRAGDPATAAAFAALYDARHQHGTHPWPPPAPPAGTGTTADALNAPATEREMRRAVQHASAGTGVSGPAFGLFKAAVAHFDSLNTDADADTDASNCMLAFLAAVFNTWLSGRPLPPALFQLHLRPVHKKGAPSVFESWRLLCPGHSLLWLLLYAAAARFGDHLEANADPRVTQAARTAAGVSIVIPDEQCGFRRRRGTQEALLVVEEVTEMLSVGPNDYANLYFDLSAAFDTVRRDSIGVAMRAAGIRGALWTAIIHLLDSFALRVQFGGLHAARDVHLSSGVVQGSPVAPLLFLVATATLRAAICTAADQAAPLRWRLPTASTTNCLCVVLFADDFVAMAKGRGWHELRPALQRIADAVQSWLHDNGMAANVRVDCSKTCVALAPRAGGDPVRLVAAGSAAPITIDGVDIPVLPLDAAYDYLGVARKLVPRNRRTSGTVHHAVTVAAPAKAAHLRGRVVSSGLGRLPPRVASLAYRSLMLPTFTYGMSVWCTAPAKVPASATAKHHANLVTLAGRGRHTSVPTACLEVAFGCLPLWAHGLRDCAVTVARVLGLHPRNAVRCALRLAVSRTAGTPHRTSTWWSRIVHTFANTAPPDAPCSFQYILQDLARADDPTLADSSHVWRATGAAEPADDDDAIDARSVAYLRRAVTDLVLRVRQWHWRCDGASPVHSSFAINANRSYTGTSFTEVRQWIGRAAVGVPLPLVDGRRDGAFRARIHGLGGVSSIVIAGYNFRKVRAMRCVVCSAPGTVTTLRHLVCHCSDVDLTSLRRLAFNRLLDAMAGLGDDVGLPQRWNSAAVADPATWTADNDDAAAGDFLSFTLGVPLVRDPVLPWERTWHSSDRACGGCTASAFRRAVLDATGALATAVVTRLQRAVWYDLKAQDDAVVVPADVADDLRQRRQAAAEQRRRQHPSTIGNWVARVTRGSAAVAGPLQPHPPNPTTGAGAAAGSSQ